MTVEKKDGGPAFPHQTSQAGYPLNNGMTLRDWFAGQALVGLLSSLGPDDPIRAEDYAALAYSLANAMLEARSK